MKNGLAAWHYCHRTTVENLIFFANKGFESISLHQNHVLECIREDGGEKLAAAVKKNRVILSVHGLFLKSNADCDVEDFHERMTLIGEWQKNYGALYIISFDVPNEARGARIEEHVNFVLDTVPDCKVALEDFGLCDGELSQIEAFKGNERFGYLIDVGHMFIRLCGKSDRPEILFHNTDKEGGAYENPGYEEFLTAFKSKSFPIFEIHLHNNDGVNDLHRFLDDGKLNISDIAKVIREIGFDGIVTIESAPGFTFKCFGADADEGIMKTAEYWNALI